MPEPIHSSASGLLSVLASVAIAEAQRPRKRSIGQAMNVRHSSLSDLVLASDVAAKFLESASTELRARTTAAPKASRETPSLIAHSSMGIVQAVLGDDRLRRRVSELEDNVQITVSPRTRSGVRLRQMRGRIQELSLADAKPDDAHLSSALVFLESEGCTVRRVGRFGITAAAPARLVSELLGTPLVLGAVRRAPIERALQLFSRQFDAPFPEDLFVAPKQSLSVAGQDIHRSIDDFVFVPPPLSSIAAVPPPVKYPCLDATGVRRFLSVDHGASDGHGVHVAVVDSGFFIAHPFFSQNGFDFQAVDMEPDATGHGTAMAWNILNIAPGCTLRGYRLDDVAGAIERAADDGARIISCSWGWPEEQTFSLLELSIRSVIEEDGATVLFAAGNGERFWPASHPLALAVGGVYANPNNGDLQASDFASGFRSNVYTGRTVPDVSGLCGLAPRGIYLPLPVPPASLADVSFHGPSFPEKDETALDDGWTYDSGTSSATAQIAGVVALMNQHGAAKGRSLTPAQVKRCLQNASRSVEQGRNAFGVPSMGRPNLAVGWGLVSASEALREIDRL